MRVYLLFSPETVVSYTYKYRIIFIRKSQKYPIIQNKKMPYQRGNVKYDLFENNVLISPDFFPQPDKFKRRKGDGNPALCICFYLPCGEQAGEIV